jgi:hypothetical protein
MNMKKYSQIALFLLLAISGSILLSCEKNTEDVTVKYVIKGLSSDFNVTFLNENEETIKIDSVVNDDWNYSFVGKKGDIVYLYVRYYEDASLSTNFYVAIEANGKAYRYTHSYDKDWGISGGKYRYQIIRSGTIPY